eukprot:scaffold3234_cov166-Amphora_coffeaeformis.AAC.18
MMKQDHSPAKWKPEYARSSCRNFRLAAVVVVVLRCRGNFPIFLTDARIRWRKVRKWRRPSDRMAWSTISLNSAE